MEDRKYFRTMVKKIKMSCKEGKNLTGAKTEDEKYQTRYNGFSALFVLERADPEQVSIDEFLLNFNVDGSSNQEFLEDFKNGDLLRDLGGFNMEKGNLTHRGHHFEHFVDDFMASKFAEMNWIWSEELDKRLGGKAGFAGRKSLYGGHKTKAMKVPEIYMNDVKVFLKFLVENNGKYILNK